VPRCRAAAESSQGRVGRSPRPRSSAAGVRRHRTLCVSWDAVHRLGRRARALAWDPPSHPGPARAHPVGSAHLLCGVCESESVCDGSDGVRQHRGARCLSRRLPPAGAPRPGRRTPGTAAAPAVPAVTVGDAMRHRGQGAARRRWAGQTVRWPAVPPGPGDAAAVPTGAGCSESGFQCVECTQRRFRSIRQRTAGGPGSSARAAIAARRSSHCPAIVVIHGAAPGSTSQRNPTTPGGVQASRSESVQDVRPSPSMSFIH
jgi:hypothetical protein